MIKHILVKLNSKDRAVTFHDITATVKKAVAESGIKNGIINVYSRHTTCSVITQEEAFDMSVSGLETLQQDFLEALQKIMPDCTREGIYLHPGVKALEFAELHGEDRRGCHNTDAHLRSALVGRGISVPIIEGKAELGDFGHVYFIDFDTTRARTRTAVLTLIDG